MANIIITKDMLMKEVIRKLDKKASIYPLANRAYEGELRRQGQTVTVQEYPSFDMDLGVTLGEDITAEDWTITDHNLTVDQAANKNLKVKDIELTRSNLSLESGLAARVAEALRRMYDQFTATTAVTGVNATNKLKELAPVALVKADVIDEINAIAQKLEESNVDIDAGKVFLFINPAVKALINSSDLVSGFDKGLALRVKGYAGSIAGMHTVSTNNLPFKQSITINGLPLATETIVINGVTFTFTAAGGAAVAGDIALGADTAGTQANVIAAVNGTGNPGASTYIELSTADRKTLKGAYVNISSFSATDVAGITAGKYIVISETGTNVVLGTASRVMFAMETNAVNVPAQMTGMKITEATQGFYSNLLFEHAFGGAVLGSNDLRVATYEITNGTTVA